MTTHHSLQHRDIQHEAPDPESAADALLAAHGALGRSHGIYTSRQLARKVRLEERRMPEVDEAGVPDEVAEYLLQRVVDDLVDVSGLSVVQEICYRLYAAGLDIEDVAATLRVRPHTVAARLRVARAKVRRAWREGRYAGWYEVYLSEVRRHR